MTVNLTSLLVLTTLFISVAGSLPQTAYVKMVDIWLIFAQVILLTDSFQLFVFHLLIIASKLIVYCSSQGIECVLISKY